ncbi:MAG TPA: response regulator transcription factor [Stellaceae bacterium]|jgi:ATP/maltotriose-dependent transcriptional regulator MalT
MRPNTSEEAWYDDTLLVGNSQIGAPVLQIVENLWRPSPNRQRDSRLPAMERHQRSAGLGSKFVAACLLSSRERSILERIGQGKSNKEIAKDLSIAPETVKSHVKNIFVKLAVKKRAQAVARAQGLGLVDALSCYF